MGSQDHDAVPELPVLASNGQSAALPANLDLSALGGEIWWQETLIFGAVSQTIRCQPDQWARETIVRQILVQAGFGEMLAALKQIVADAEGADRFASATGGGLDGWNSAEAGAYERCADIAREAIAKVSGVDQ